MTKPSARDVAARSLSRVFEDAAHAAIALDTEIERAGLDGRDAGLATELTYGVLRVEGHLDETARALSSRGTLIDHHEALAHLFIGLYSISFLDRIPPFAAVSEAVDAIRALIGEKPAGFANAILRAHARTIETKGRPPLGRTIVESTPGWLKGALRKSIGRRGSIDFLASAAHPPPLHLAVGDPFRRGAIIEALCAESAGRDSESEGASFEPLPRTPHGVRGTSSKHPRRLSGYDQDWIVQEEGAQLVALALGATPGATVLDACAGRGNKAWLLSHIVGPTGAITLVDKFPSKLEAFSTRDPKIARIETALVDLSVGLGDIEGRQYQFILVDAPCSGVGTLRRRPEIARAKSEASITELAELQFQITKRAATLLGPGGVLVYAVCSVLEEECESVVARLLQEPGLSLTPAELTTTLGPELAPDGASAIRLLPHVHDTDGFFVARFRRVAG